MEEKILIEAKNLKKYFKVGASSQLHAVDGVNFKIKRGTTLGVVGESGCGKSTLGRLLLRLYDVTDGQIIYDGTDITKLNAKELKPIRARMQMIFQDPSGSLDPRKSVKELIGEPLKIYKACKNRDEYDARIAEIMETLDTPITTITGIGPTLGAYILSEIGDISRFSSAAKLAAYAGIDPTMRQSGEYNGVRNRMSKRGSPYLRHAIWLAASSAVLHDPALKLYFQKKRDEGKPYMASVGHACRKMVSIIYAVMRDNKAYTPCIPNEISA